MLTEQAAAARVGLPYDPRKGLPRTLDACASASDHVDGEGTRKGPSWARDQEVDLDLGQGPAKTAETDAQRLAKKHAARRAAREAEEQQGRGLTEAARRARDEAKEAKAE
eukprot:scaffold128889_cov37-Phaeocystis_antarctica.AAC.1